MFTPNLNTIYAKKPLRYAYAQLILWGYNYSFKRYRARKIVLNLQYAYNFVLHVPTPFVYRVYKRRLVLFGEKLDMLRLIVQLVHLKRPDKYTGKGLRLRSLPYRLKPSKNKKKT